MILSENQESTLRYVKSHGRVRYASGVRGFNAAAAKSLVAKGYLNMERVTEDDVPKAYVSITSKGNNYLKDWK